MKAKAETHESSKAADAFKWLITFALLAAAVVGNSSSGIIEVPSFDVATIDIGMRQKGRLAAKSVIHCAPSKSDIVHAIQIGIDKKYKIKDEKICNPYGQGDASGQIITLLKDIQESTFKSFYDLNVGDIK